MGRADGDARPALHEEFRFATVVITPLVFDAEGRKMSKSLGNVIDPIDLAEKYGADAFRHGSCARCGSRARSCASGISLRRGAELQQQDLERDPLPSFAARRPACRR